MTLVMVLNRLPTHLRGTRNQRRICLIVEGFEEYHYFKRLQDLPIFDISYHFHLINAKGSSNIPARYQAALASDSYAIVLVVCDLDKTPDAYRVVEDGIGEVIGKENAGKVITFVRPCTLQIILSHFGDVALESQAKRESRDIVEKLTGVRDYDAHQEQLIEICSQVFQRTWGPMRQRLRLLSKNPEDIPSSNIEELFDCLCCQGIYWIDYLNESTFNDG